MLRRYSSHGLETILIQSENLTIGSDKCNVILKAEEGVHPIHASIQQNMESGLFWLRDHSLAGRTTVNGHHVDGQVELHNGDMLRFGKAQPFVFERRVVFPCKERSNFHEAVVGRNYPKLTTFPILGRKKRISQRPIPSKSPARRSATTVAQLKHYAEEVSERAESEDRANSVSSSIETPSSTYSGKNVRGSVGNNLLQRVVRLQDELARKNHEIDELRRQRSQYFEDPSSSFKQNSYRLPHLSETLSSVERNFELEAYRSLIAMVAAKVRSFNDVVLRSRHRSYSDVFSAFINITEKPISQKLFEIEKECDVELARKGFSAMQRAHLADFFRRNGRDEILSVAGEIEILVPIIRNACATAEESILVCNVFTQWSRQLADQIRVEGLTGMQLLDAIDKLKENFYREHMENHWLLPSISPLLSLTAYELEKTRENSSTETNGGTQAANDSSRTVPNGQPSKDKAKNIKGKQQEDMKENIMLSEEPFERFLSDAEVKVAELEHQLHELQKKANEKEKISESTRQRMDQLLLRVSSTAHSTQKEALGDNEEKLRSKPSMGSIMSIEVTENDVHEGSATGEDEFNAQLRTVMETEEVRNSQSGRFRRSVVVEYPPSRISAIENDNSSQIMDELRFNEELYQIYSDCALFLGRPINSIEDYKDEKTIVKKELMLEVMDCIRALMSVLSMQKNKNNRDNHGEDHSETSGNLHRRIFSVEQAERQGGRTEKRGEGTAEEAPAIEGAKSHEKSQPTKVHDRNHKESEEKQENQQLHSHSESEHKKKDGENPTEHKDYEVRKENELSDAFLEQKSRVNFIASTGGTEEEEMQAAENSRERKKEPGITSSEGYRKTGNDSLQETSAPINRAGTNASSKTIDENAFMKYGTSYKYHIQSHINTSTRTPGFKHTPKYSRSPTDTRKDLARDIEDELRPPLLQPRFVF